MGSPVFGPERPAGQRRTGARNGQLVHPQRETAPPDPDHIKAFAYHITRRITLTSFLRTKKHRINPERHGFPDFLPPPLPAGQNPTE